MEITIKKAKLSRGGCVEAVFIDEEGNEISLKGRNKCHADLKAAFNALVPFFVDLTEQREAQFIDWSCPESEGNADLLARIDVTGISLGGDSGRFVTMTGRRTLFTSQVLNLNSPALDMDSETFEWEHLDEFDIALMSAIDEVRAYIVDRKWEVVQQEIDFDSDPEDPFGQTTPTDELTSSITDVA